MRGLAIHCTPFDSYNMDYTYEDSEGDDDDLFVNPNHGGIEEEGKVITFMSFGHKHGIPGGNVVHFNIQTKVPRTPEFLVPQTPK